MAEYDLGDREGRSFLLMFHSDSWGFGFTFGFEISVMTVYSNIVKSYGIMK
jgi:hypothetical protein